MKKNKLWKSFNQDAKFKQERLSLDILDIYSKSEGYKKSLRLKLRGRVRVSDSIETWRYFTKMKVHVWKLTCIWSMLLKILSYRKMDMVSIDKIIENKNSVRLWSIFCFTLSQFFVQNDQTLAKKAI